MDLNPLPEAAGDPAAVPALGDIPKRVLVVDEDPNALTLIARVLGDGLNAEIQVASSSESAIESLCRALPDLLIVDVSRPRLNGIAVLEHLQIRYNRTGAIATSGYGSAPLLWAQQAGALELLRKPIREKELLESAERVLRAPGSWLWPKRSRRRPMPTAALRVV